jgi:hypothetical protein
MIISFLSALNPCLAQQFQAFIGLKFNTQYKWVDTHPVFDLEITNDPAILHLSFLRNSSIGEKLQFRYGLDFNIDDFYFNVYAKQGTSLPPILGYFSQASFSIPFHLRYGITKKIHAFAGGANQVQLLNQRKSTVVIFEDAPDFWDDAEIEMIVKPLEGSKGYAFLAQYGVSWSPVKRIGLEFMVIHPISSLTSPTLDYDPVLASDTRRPMKVIRIGYVFDLKKE